MRTGRAPSGRSLLDSSYVESNVQTPDPQAVSRRREGRSQTSRAAGAAVALDDLLAVRVVVVGQLFAGLDVPSGPDPDVLADDLAVAVRPAGVIDEARDVAADHGVAHPAAIHREAPDLAALQVLRFAREAFLVV